MQRISPQIGVSVSLRQRFGFKYKRNEKNFIHLYGNVI